MSSAWFYSLLSVAIVSLISFVGVFTLSLNKQRLQDFLLYFVSFSAGALLGDVFIHILPEIAEEKGFTLSLSFYILVGIVTTFILEKVIHWHHAQDANKHKHLHPVTFLTLFGDGVHNFIDGAIIAASFMLNFQLGIATSIAVVLHEIPQEIGNFGVLVHGGFTKGKALFYNFLSALTAVIGALVVLVLGSQLEGSLTILTAYTAGTFIYIVGADLIPELHKEVSIRKNLIQFVWLLLGIVVMFSLLLLE
ncbi:hypothetical protein A3G67_02905 [Candidatus Roizmanbacteria bacterium RIFCSPLOWO2_12_FULL_40_12]|uniref:Zinc/iron permease n=1 Tax=Candidatus Roizmanbacteria bacterium RIFCSPLOWO2_01_FULL_40_42 TaxID=1802066 RepID=A0A1F7J2P4_9BACT|nr:MAG: hypothetical protein A2779_00435 [Candidatus Roizmanbacteria bacterium RIFCSPHIGHO2_01_FULL_40_98]OGK27526.1 MAG: hypothetical protein A3C31_03590 [Candidatus Roizmanbacteria bacterium RIFCSPHIGHO2_02_FULL_40_53]OGK30282.1 MAG: hypothetical protein A2W49_01075 [Candidatus Roizmanbacteria bacterium RIFCSPHIGHO2_12_41_18]OGK37118.1 MAG: hypothetical protein A3E69_01520 [Candidatus Roizmanbacteria bacterium RIFCSPHIGHO2_12_FULL_40_130]OGK49888.1 MAG: hypothetical protein A3B50_03830 [Candi